MNKQNETTEKPHIFVDNAEIESVDTLAKKIDKLNKDFQDQKNYTRNIIIGVLLASVLIVVTVAIEVILFHSNKDQDSNDNLSITQNPSSPPSNIDKNIKTKKIK